MRRMIDARAAALSSIAAVVIGGCAGDESREQEDLPLLAQVLRGADLGVPHLIATLGLRGVRFSTPDGEALAPEEVEARAAVLREAGTDASLRIVADASVPVRALLDMFEALALHDGFHAEFVVREGDRTRALRVLVYGSPGERTDELGCAHMQLFVDEGRVVANIADTTIRAKPRAPLFRSVEDRTWTTRAHEAAMLLPVEAERPDDGYTLTGDPADPYALLDDLLGRSLGSSVPCSEATIFLARDLSWQRLAPLVGGLGEVGLDAVCLYPTRVSPFE